MGSSADTFNSRESRFSCKDLETCINCSSERDKTRIPNTNSNWLKFSSRVFCTCMCQDTWIQDFNQRPIPRYLTKQNVAACSKLTLKANQRVSSGNYRLEVWTLLPGREAGWVCVLQVQRMEKLLVGWGRGRSRGWDR